MFFRQLLTVYHFLQTLLHLSLHLSLSPLLAPSVGYVVGLGDRHVQNILIDCNSAELVHIDLGILFTLRFCVKIYF